MNYSKIKKFANKYYDELKLGKRPRREIKREFYDNGGLIANENTLDVIWTSMMEGRFNPNVKSLGRTNKKGINIMSKEIKKRGPKSRSFCLLDRDTKEVVKEYDSITAAAKEMNINPNTIRSILKGNIQKPKHLFVYVDDYNKENKNLSLDVQADSPKEPKQPKMFVAGALMDIPGEVNHINKHDFEMDLTVQTEPEKKDDPVAKEQEQKQAPRFVTNDDLIKNLDDARNAYIEALRKCVDRSINLYGIKLEENDMHLIAYLESEVIG